MNGLPGSPPLMDVASCWPANLVLLFAVVSKGIAGVNVLSWCTTDAGGAIARAISGSNSVFVNGTVLVDGLGQIDFLGKGKGVPCSISKVICGSFTPSLSPNVRDLYFVSSLSIDSPRIQLEKEQI